MAAKKNEEIKQETVKTETVKTEAVKAEAEVKPAQPKKRGRKPASEKAAAEKTAKPAAKKAPAKRASKPAEKKIITKIQFGANEYDTEDIAAACKADYKAKTNGHVRSLTVYIKPEEATAYYVVNNKYSDKVEL